MLLVVMTVLGAAGGASLKWYAMIKRWPIMLVGFGFYGTGALLNIYLLQQLPYTLVLPANAMTFIWSMLLARVLFKERIGPARLAGLCLLMAGLLLLEW